MPGEFRQALVETADMNEEVVLDVGSLTFEEYSEAMAKLRRNLKDSLSGTAIIVTGSLLLYYGTPHPNLFQAMMLFGSVAFLMGLYPAWRERERNRVDYKRFVENFPMKYELSRDGMRTEGPTAVCTYKWSHFDALLETDQTHVLRTSSGQLVIVPKRLVAGQAGFGGMLYATLSSVGVFAEE